MGEKGSSKADTLVKVVLVFFISLLSFSVGTFVGKQVSDSEHRKIALEGEFKGEGREIASEKSEHGEGEHADAEHGKISDKEVASLTEEFVNKEGDATEGHGSEGHGSDAHAASGHAPADAHAAAEPAHATESKSDAKPEAEGYKTYSRKLASDEGHDVKTEAHEEKPAEKATAAADKGHGAPDKGHAAPEKSHGSDKSHAADKVAEKLAEGHAPSDGAHETAKPAAHLPSVAGSAVGKYTVQVSSYTVEKDAKEHAASLKAKGFQAFYLGAKVDGKERFRVLVGLFTTVKSADAYMAQLLKEGGVKAAYVQKIVQ